jgi:hypothetical protein
MCEECLRLIKAHINSTSTFKTARGIEFTIKDVPGDKRPVQTSSGKPRQFHLDHAALCLHFIKVNGKEIDGVGAGSGTSIKDLVGIEGKLTQCEICDRTISYTWGLLGSMPNVHKGERHQLSYH